jgi:membrane-bound metal-dependent hydrolase YbcI (DUF457 family)
MHYIYICGEKRNLNDRGTCRVLNYSITHALLSLAVNIDYRKQLKICLFMVNACNVTKPKTSITTRILRINYTKCRPSRNVDSHYSRGWCRD